MDPETESHVEKARRAPVQSTPSSFQRADGETPLEHLEPHERRRVSRERRADHKLEEALDRMVPLEEKPVGDGHIEYRVTTECSMCHGEMILRFRDDDLFDLEDGQDPVAPGRPGLMARAVAAGLVRRRRFGFACDACVDQAEAAARRAETEEAQRRRLETANLDTALRGFEFAQMATKDGRGVTIAAARAWAAEEFPDPRGLCLFGEKGAGKTRLAATAAWQRLRRYPLTWVSWPILLAQLGAAFNDKARAQAIKVLTGKGALVLDDIDKSNPSEWAKTQLFSAIDKRVTSGAPLLITTNVTLERIGELFGEPTMSRIGGYCRVLELPGNDQRLQFNFDGTPKEGK